MLSTGPELLRGGGGDPEPGQLGAEHLQPLHEGPELGVHCHRDRSPLPAAWLAPNPGQGSLQGALSRGVWGPRAPQHGKGRTQGVYRNSLWGHPARPPPATNQLSLLPVPRRLPLLLVGSRAPVSLRSPWPSQQRQPQRHLGPSVGSINPPGSAPRRGQSCTEQRAARAEPPTLAASLGHAGPSCPEVGGGGSWGTQPPGSPSLQPPLGHGFSEDVSREEDRAWPGRHKPRFRRLFLTLAV